MSQISDITTLQAIDDESASLAAARDDVERRLAGDEELATAKSALETANTAVALLQREQRRLDGEIEGLSSKIIAEEKRLYDGSVKNPKELGSIQHEVDSFKEKRSVLEDELLEVLSQLEAAESARTDADTLAATLQARWEAEEARLQQEAARLDALIAAAEARRQQQASRLQPLSLALYERVRARRGNMVVTHIKGGACSGCRISLPDAVRRRALSPDTLVQCPNCDRILAAG
jgi:predicted  nucleic acid-binding Zn-ribbon protein